MNCEICFHPYDHSKRKPYVLSCPHRFCLSCMTKRLNDKRCPVCEKPIRSKFPNLNLMKTLPESIYDRTRRDLEQVVCETTELKQRLSQHCENKFNSSLQRVQAQRVLFLNKSNELISLLKKNQQILLDEFNSIELLLNKSLNDLRDQSNISDQVKYVKQVLETNELEEFELIELKNSFARKKEDLSQHLDHVDRFNGNYDVIYNENVNVHTGLMAEIKQSKLVVPLVDHGMTTTTASSNHLKPADVNVITSSSNKKSNLTNSAKKIVKRYSIAKRETPKKRRFVL